jgi:hypothetical protein
MALFDFRERRRRRRRQQIDPARQVGNAVGRGLAGVVSGLVSAFFRRK